MKLLINKQVLKKIHAQDHAHYKKNGVLTPNVKKGNARLTLNTLIIKLMVY